MTGKKISLRLAKGRPADRIHAVIWYGKKGGRDIDLLTVVSDELVLPPKVMAFSGIDFFPVRASDFYRRLGQLDPSVTEPVLTGRLLHGDKREFARLKKELKNRRVQKADIEFLRSKSREQLRLAREYVDLYKRQTPDPRFLCYSLFCLTYVLSCSLFARHYRQNPEGVITFSRLRRQKCALLEKVMAEYKRAKDLRSADLACLLDVIGQVKDFVLRQ